jgi:hypothetical protein
MLLRHAKTYQIIEDVARLKIMIAHNVLVYRKINQNLG